ncbi:MAG TPA: FGGY family carbohydrate kinase [Mycobacteriales bacterium]|nr:FGGY family carbohydrate kinase [Mycobacteriales bacterium]
MSGPDSGGAILAVDQGTSSTKALVVAPDGSVLAVAQVAVHPKPVGDDGVEQDPAELYESVVEAGRRALASSGVDVVTIGFANQGETVMAWDRTTGDPLAPALSWQDRRSAAICADLSAHADRLLELTGLPLDPYFAGPKVRWLREHGIADGVVTTTDTWLLHRLTGAFVTDVTTASRTALLDLTRREWSAEACELFGVDPDLLPDVVGCTATVGHTYAFGPSLPVTGLAVDQQAALYGEGCLRPGDSKCTYGTGAFLLANAGPGRPRSTHGLSASVGWDDRGDIVYCLDGQLYTVGSMVDWLVGRRLLAGPADLDPVASSVPDAGGVVCVPALAGLGAPYWTPQARASFEGVSLATTDAHLVRAVVDGIAGQVALLAQAAAADLGEAIGLLRVDGGLTASRVLMQTQADLLQAPVEVYPSPHATALGVAQLARRGLGEPVVPVTVPGERYEPRIGADEAAARLDRLAASISRAIEATPSGGDR